MVFIYLTKISMKKAMFIKPNIQTDAIWDPIRTTMHAGIRYLASKLKQSWYEVRYLDEVVRTQWMLKKALSQRDMTEGKMQESPLPFSYEDIQLQKMKDFEAMSPSDFVAKYSAFKEHWTISRIIATTGNPIDETLKTVLAYQPDMVGIPLIATANYLPATMLAKRIKDMLPETKLILWGQHISANPHTFIQDNPYVDHVITGDAIWEIADILEGKYTEKIIHGGYQWLENFPLLDMEVLKENAYPRDQVYSYPTNWRNFVDFMFSKWCLRGCEFCVAWSQKDNCITKNTSQKIDEQLRIFKDNGVEELIVQDDAFLQNKEQVKERLWLMKKYWLYRQNNGGLEFERIDDFVTDLFIKYNKTGEWKITALYVPFNPRTWNKNDSASKSMVAKYHQNMNNLKRLREEGWIYVYTSAIIGTPEQTRASFDEELSTDRALIQQGYIDAALCFSATILPGTKRFEKNGNNIIDKCDYPGYSLSSTHHRTEQFTPREIEELMVTRTKNLSDIQSFEKRNSAFPNKK